MRVRRWVILAFGLPLYVLALVILSTIIFGIIVHDRGPLAALARMPELLREAMGEPDWWMAIGLTWSILTAAQIVFLLPVIRARPPKGERGKSLAISLIIAAGIAALLTLGFAFGAISGIQVATSHVMDDAPDWVWAIPLVVLCGSWAFWTIALLLYVRGIWADRVLGRLAGVLIAGSLVEMVAILPIDIMIRRRTECYCEEGSFFTLIIGSMAVLWLAGPGAVIVLFSKRHRAFRETHCEKCGYAKGPSPGERCPECGFEWSRARIRQQRRHDAPTPPRYDAAP